MLGKIFIIFIIITILIVLTVGLGQRHSLESFEVDKNLKLPNYQDEDVNPSNNNIGASNDHLELAYKLCQNNPEKDCQKYIYHYDSLRRVFRKLKLEYCQNNPSRCMELNI